MQRGLVSFFSSRSVHKISLRKISFLKVYLAHFRPSRCPAGPGACPQLIFLWPFLRGAAHPPIIVGYEDNCFSCGNPIPEPPDYALLQFPYQVRGKARPSPSHWRLPEMSCREPPVFHSSAQLFRQLQRESPISSARAISITLSSAVMLPDALLSPSRRSPRTMLSYIFSHGSSLSS